MIWFIFDQYFYLRQTIPLFLYVFYIVFRDENEFVIETLISTSIMAVVLFLMYTTMGLIFRIPFKTLIPFTWAYLGPITWGMLFLSYFYLLTQKGQNSLTSFTLATLAIVGGGWLYEVPYFHPLSMFMGTASFFYNNAQILCLLLLISEIRKRQFKPNILIYITLILCMLFGRINYFWPNAQILCLIFLGYELKKIGFTPNRFILANLILYLVFSTYLFLNKDHLCCISREWYMLLAYGYRGPASLFLLSLLSGVKKNV